ncbi:MAG: DUF1192 domain-containing protein [Alphaproteobacteria bacterium]|nr:DUF1192 domain-containing protein [Alphaproteobacteria bacterium]
MDWDDVRKPASNEKVVVGETLERHSVAELEQRIRSLEAEIQRVRGELAAKRDHEARAASIFKT